MLNQARFCTKCGTNVAASAPSANLESVSATIELPNQKPIWNPSATANWSFLFSPIFGAYLQARNWDSLGQRDRAKASYFWFYFGIAFYLLLPFIAIALADPQLDDKPWIAPSLLFFFFWYFTDSKRQAKFVEQQMGKAYQKRSWTKPLLLGITLRVLYQFYFFLGFALAQISL